jgi:hypothetical protein
MMSFTRTIWLLGLLAICVSGCKSEGTAATKNTDEKSQPVPVQVFRVQPTAIARVLAYDADIQGSLEVKVFSQVPERILSPCRPTSARPRHPWMLPGLTAIGSQMSCPDNRGCWQRRWSPRPWWTDCA